LIGGSLLAALMVGCGKPASVEDCQHIMARITELELKAANVTDPAAIATQIERTRQSFDELARGECVGRRLSESTRKCVDEATTAKQIVDECFD
jgi:hypothetical protein